MNSPRKSNKRFILNRIVIGAGDGLLVESTLAEYLSLVSSTHIRQLTNN